MNEKLIVKFSKDQIHSLLSHMLVNDQEKFYLVKDNGIYILSLDKEIKLDAQVKEGFGSEDGEGDDFCDKIPCWHIPSETVDNMLVLEVTDQDILFRWEG